MKRVKPILVMLSLFLMAYSFMGMTDNPVYNVKLKMSNIRSSEGRLQLRIFKDEAAYEDRKPLKTILISKEGLKNQYLEHVITIEKGSYGFSMLDDENANGKMDYSFMTPKEGFAFANYYHKGWSQPKFESFKVTVDGDTYMSMQFRYL